MIIFFFSDIPWEGLYQRPHHLAKRLSKNYIVIWIEPFTLSNKLNFKLKNIGENLYSVTVPTIPYNARNKFIKKLAFFLSSCKIFRLTIQFIQYKIIEKITSEINHKKNDEYVFFFENFQISNITRYFKPKIIIYDYIDNAFGFTKLPDHIVKMWQHLVENSNFIITTSNNLIKQIKSIRTENVYLVTNGVEYNLFSSPQTHVDPPDLPKDKKIVGYIGAIYPWLDFELIAYLCSKISHINFVFIGKEHPEIEKSLTNLKKYNNFFYLGFKNYKDIPAYSSRFNIGIIPFKRNELTEGVNPVKLFEYSATGIPTVCTNFSDDLEEYKDLIFISNTKEEFLQNLFLALEKSTQSDFINKIKNFAKVNDWNEKYKIVNSLIENYLRKS